MLEIPEDVYKKVLAEESEYAALLEKNRRRELSFYLGLRLWFFGLVGLTCLVLGLSPRFRFLLIAAGAVLPFFGLQLFNFKRRDKWIQERLDAEAEERRLKVLQERQEIRQNILAQKAAQDEIERLKAEIEVMKKGETSS